MPITPSGSALSELLDALRRAGDGTDLGRELAQQALQPLVEAGRIVARRPSGTSLGSANR